MCLIFLSALHIIHNEVICMIESINDLISLLMIVILFIGLGYLILRDFIHHRRRKVMEEEIEYYKEW
jgi:hypothetical protein